MMLQLDAFGGAKVPSTCFEAPVFSGHPGGGFLGMTAFGPVSKLAVYVALYPSENRFGCHCRVVS